MKVLLNNFSGGVIDPKFAGRIELQGFSNSCQDITNFLVESVGGVKRIPDPSNDKYKNLAMNFTKGDKVYVLSDDENSDIGLCLIVCKKTKSYITSYKNKNTVTEDTSLITKDDSILCIRDELYFYKGGLRKLKINRSSTALTLSEATSERKIKKIDAVSLMHTTAVPYDKGDVLAINYYTKPVKSKSVYFTHSSTASTENLYALSSDKFVADPITNHTDERAWVSEFFLVRCFKSVPVGTVLFDSKGYLDVSSEYLGARYTKASIPKYIEAVDVQPNVEYFEEIHTFEQLQSTGATGTLEFVQVSKIGGTNEVDEENDDTLIKQSLYVSIPDYLKHATVVAKAYTSTDASIPKYTSNLPVNATLASSGKCTVVVNNDGKTRFFPSGASALIYSYTLSNASTGNDKADLFLFQNRLVIAQVNNVRFSSVGVYDDFFVGQYPDDGMEFKLELGENIKAVADYPSPLLLSGKSEYMLEYRGVALTPQDAFLKKISDYGTTGAFVLTQGMIIYASSKGGLNRIGYDAQTDSFRGINIAFYFNDTIGKVEQLVYAYKPQNIIGVKSDKGFFILTFDAQTGVTALSKLDFKDYEISGTSHEFADMISIQGYLAFLADGVDDVFIIDVDNKTFSNEAYLKTSYMMVGIDQIAGQGKIKRIKEVFVRCLKSKDFLLKQDTMGDFMSAFNSSSFYGEEKSGDLSAVIGGDFSETAQLEIKTIDDNDVRILGLYADVDLYGG